MSTDNKYAWQLSSLASNAYKHSPEIQKRIANSLLEALGLGGYIPGRFRGL